MNVQLTFAKRETTDEVWFGSHVLTITDKDSGRDVAHLPATEHEGIAEDLARLFCASPKLLEAMKGVVRVADRATAEFDAAHQAMAEAEWGTPS